MSLSPNSAPVGKFNSILHSFVQGPGLPLRDVLTEEMIHRAATAERVESFGTIYTTALVVWAFVTQALAKDQTCLAAVLRIIAAVTAAGQPPCSSGTGAYCKARQKLSDAFLRRLTYDIGNAVEDAAPAAWRWHGRRALLIDGTTLSAPDTPANQAVYPQSARQKKGLGFPIIRLVVLLTLATATLTGAAFGPYAGKETGESALLRTLFAQLRRGDLVVADRYYCSYWMLAMLPQFGVDCVFRKHQLRRDDDSPVRSLGVDDAIFIWTKPVCPNWMDATTYAALPDQLELRQIRKRVETPGFRVQDLVVMTTLLDPAAASKDAVLDLYQQRWHAELDLRSIKQFLQMDVLRCQTPAMLHKEIWAHLLAYNLVRKVMAQAATTVDLTPRQLSFQATVQTLNEFRSDLLRANGERREELARIIFEAIGRHRVGDRPDRCEPRAVKRRPKPHDLLTVPRAEARARLMERREAEGNE